MRAMWTHSLCLALCALAACSASSTGDGNGAVATDVHSDSVTLKTDVETSEADAADAVTTDEVDVPAIADEQDAAAEDAVEDAVTDAGEQTDLAGFFDDTGVDDAVASDVEIVCGDSGLVKGVACAPKAGVSVAFANISIDISTPCLSSGNTFHADTVADVKGSYAFNAVPPGVGTVKIVKGSFQTSIPVTIVGGQTLDLTQPTSDRCFKAGAVKIAVVQGDADSIETLLTELGFAHDDFATSSGATSAGAKFLGDGAKMNTYDVIFVDCGSKLDTIFAGTPKNTITANIKAFVAAGHSLYASDWAWLMVESAFPTAIEFYGDDLSTSKATAGPKPTAGPRQGPGPSLTEKKAGAAAYTTTGNVVDAGLAAVLGKSSTTIYEDLGTWVVMQSAGPGTTVEIESTVTDTLPATGTWGTVPLVVRFPSGAGHVVYTSFHNIAVKDAGGPVDEIKAILTYLVFTL